MRVYEECEMWCVCEYALALKQVCMWLPVGWVCRVGIFQAPCCSRNICPLCGTNQSAEPKAVTNQAAWWSFHGILGWSWNKGRHLPPLPSSSPSLPTPFRLWYLRPPHGEITSPSLRNPTDHDRKMTDLGSPVRWHIWKLVCFTHPRLSASLWYCLMNVRTGICFVLHLFISLILYEMKISYIHNYVFWDYFSAFFYSNSLLFLTFSTGVTSSAFIIQNNVISLNYPYLNTTVHDKR